MAAKMNEITVYHNPRCSKSRNALAYLDEKGVDYSVVEYLKDNLTESDLKDIISKLSIRPIDLVRKGEAIYKENYKDFDPDKQDWIQIMIGNPKLIERPIVVKGTTAVVARPTEKIDELIF